jgi:hypothetical protein
MVITSVHPGDFFESVNRWECFKTNQQFALAFDGASTNFESRISGWEQGIDLWHINPYLYTTSARCTAYPY